MEFQQAYLLHSRPYRENSAIVEILTQESGRVTAVARLGSGKKSNKRAILQPFQRLSIRLRGHGELQNLSQVELDTSTQKVNLIAEKLYSAMYMNELLVRLLPKHIPCDDLFEHYQTTLALLSNAPISFEASLRRFEMNLLIELGVQPDIYQFIGQEEHDGVAQYLSGLGLVVVEFGGQVKYPLAIRDLAAIAHDKLDDEQVLRTYKLLTRLVLAEHLGDKPLQSRKLFLHKRTKK